MPRWNELGIADPNVVVVGRYRLHRSVLSKFPAQHREYALWHMVCQDIILTIVVWIIIICVMDQHPWQRLITPIPLDLLLAIDDYRFGTRQASRSAAVRELLVYALTAHGRLPADLPKAADAPPSVATKKAPATSEAKAGAKRKART
jgi:hypothetical protein